MTRKGKDREDLYHPKWTDAKGYPLTVGGNTYINLEGVVIKETTPAQPHQTDENRHGQVKRKKP